MKLFLGATIIGVIAALLYLNVFATHKTTSIIKKTVNSPVFSLDNAPSSSLKATILSLSGDTAWQSRTATEPASLTSPRQVQQGEKLVTKDNGTLSLAFANICTITMANKTTLNLVQTLPANIVIAQSMGQATYEKIDSTPVSIESLDLLINIPKSDSLVSITTTKSLVSVSVQKGTVTVAYNSIENVTTVVTVKEGQDFVFNNNTSYGSLE